MVKIANVRETKPGHFYFIKKIGGRTKYTPLPEPSHPDFAKELRKCRMAADKVDAAKKSQTDVVNPGSFAALVAEYRASSDYRQLNPKTAYDYEPHLASIIETLGQTRVKDFKASQAEAMRDDLLDTPGKANNWLKILRNLIDLGCRRDYVLYNVTAKIPLLKLGEHQPWPQEVLDRVLGHVTPTTRLALLTGLYSGQRISDCIRMTHAMMSGEIMHLVQLKKRSYGQRQIEVYIPIHPLWRQAVEEVPVKTTHILYNRYGKPYRKTAALQERVWTAMKQLGYVDADGQILYHFHGLRKNSTNYLAEMGLTPHEIGAINGMSIETVILYTRGVQTKRLAESSRVKVLSGNASQQAR